MLIVLVSLVLLQSADPVGTKHSDPVPAEIASGVSALLSPGGVRVSVNANTLTFWWVKELGIKSAAAGWADLAEGSLVGAVKIEKDFRDIRGRVIKPGTYTLRYGIQPANGDHLGVSPFREFLLLSPAAADTDPAPRGHKGTVEISKETIGGSHPAVWSIDPPVASEATLSVHTTELGHKAIVMEVPVQGGVMRFGLVLVGKIEA
ncbi:MAG TPA: hypothetical protein VEL51_14200 [Vicinamibacterales bacterium]|nr:hypothetical protein [Vicinamibacterales bacterium]